MSLPLIFKHDNPGCPCCGLTLQPSPCACYPFDDHANNVVFDGLHLTSTYPSYATGKLANATKHTGTQYHEHPHHTCYVPEQASSPTSPLFGINVWFWIKRAKPASATGTAGIEYVVTKGLFPDGAVEFSAAPNLCLFPGTWSIFIDPQTYGSGRQFDLKFAVAYENSCVDVVTQQSWEHPTDWVFFYWWYEPTAGIAGTHTGKYSIIRNGATTVDEQSVAVGVAGVNMRQTDPENFYVGKDLGAVNSETILIDNVGVSRHIGTKAEMTARATDLYNSGAGVACPADGQ